MKGATISPSDYLFFISDADEICDFVEQTEVKKSVTKLHTTI